MKVSDVAPEGIPGLLSLEMQPLSRDCHNLSTYTIFCGALSYGHRTTGHKRCLRNVGRGRSRPLPEGLQLLLQPEPGTPRLSFCRRHESHEGLLRRQM